MTKYHTFSSVEMQPIPQDTTLEDFLDELNTMIDDAICDDEGNLRAMTLLYHLNKNGYEITKKENRHLND